MATVARHSPDPIARVESEKKRKMRISRILI